MSDQPEKAVGKIEWCDLTVPNADEVKDFYNQVIGWNAEALDMGGYSDYNMLSPETDQPIAGVCFARGENENLPPQWLLYITVEDVEASVRKCLELGGKTIDGPRMMGDRKFCCISDPSGAVIGLIEA
jgi:hypothetical protein